MTMQTASQTALKAGAKVSAPRKPPTRVVSLWLPNFSIDRLNRQSVKPPHPEAAPPQATVLKEQGGLRIAAVNPAAQAVGIGPGLPLSDARALQPDLKVTPAEPAKDIRALAALADWCGRYTPWTAPEAGGDAGESGDGGCNYNN